MKNGKNAENLTFRFRTYFLDFREVFFWGDKRLDRFRYKKKLYLKWSRLAKRSDFGQHLGMGQSTNIPFPDSVWEWNCLKSELSEIGTV